VAIKISSKDGEIQLVARHEDLIEIEGTGVRRDQHGAAIEADRDLHHPAVAGKKLTGDMRGAGEARGCRPAQDGRLGSWSRMETDVAGRHTVGRRGGGVEPDARRAITAQIAAP